MCPRNAAIQLLQDQRKSFVYLQLIHPSRINSVWNMVLRKINPVERQRNITILDIVTSGPIASMEFVLLQRQQQQHQHPQHQQRLKHVSLMETHVGRTWHWSTKEFAVPLDRDAMSKIQ